MLKGLKFAIILLGIIVYLFMVIAMLMGSTYLTVPTGFKIVSGIGFIFIVIRLMIDMVDLLTDGY